MPTITLTITLTVPEGTNVEVSTDTHQEPTVEVVQVPEPSKAIAAPEPLGIFHGEYGQAPSIDKRWVGYWNDIEDELAQDLTISDAELAETLGRTCDAVHTYRYHKGYREPSRNRVIVPTRRAMARWTDVETVELLQLVGEHGEDWSIIGARLGRSEAAVKRQYERSLVMA